MDTHEKDFGLASAREVAAGLRTRVKAGEDISRTKQEQSAEIPETFEALADEWYARTIESMLKHPRVVRRVLDKHIIPSLEKKLRKKYIRAISITCFVRSWTLGRLRLPMMR